MNIVVAVDGSHVASHALSKALDIAIELAAAPTLHLVSVVDYVDAPAGLSKAPQSAPDLLAAEAETALAAANEFVEARGYRATSHILRGHVVHEVLQFARDHGARLIAVGTHGRSGVKRAILGSTCEGLIRSSEIPILAVHGA
jgi:nucleotide-binding universal stress UspA family protein